ncbi:MAG: BMP family ABC transporter substrate-binding protein [Defluviitaleaceae bacterium]|nr:BMP family ABC transporter substrate-binding protein [Defluviitaleaceae bacterium]
MHKNRALLSTIVALLACVFLLAACGQRGSDDREPDLTLENVRLAFIHVGDQADRGYTYRQHRGTTDMMAALGISERQVLNFWNITPGAAVTTSIEEAIEWGADMIFGTSFAFGAPMLEAARQYPDVHFFHATGNLAVEANLPNYHNYFGNMSQGRFLSGVAAGLRTESNILGFVAAWPNPEVITGYTAFFLGAQSVNPDVRMYVMYLNAWNDPTVEGQIAQALIDRGADVLGQHADSPTTQTVAQSAGVWSVGYNNDMRNEAPDAFLVAPMFDWSVYLTYAVRTLVENGPGSVRTDVLYGLNEGMVLLSDLNPATVVPGTAEAIAEAEARLRGGWNIFTGPIYGADGVRILADGEQWREPISAPSWAHIVRGITVLD